MFKIKEAESPEAHTVSYNAIPEDSEHRDVPMKKPALSDRLFSEPDPQSALNLHLHRCGSSVCSNAQHIVSGWQIQLDVLSPCRSQDHVHLPAVINELLPKYGNVYEATSEGLVKKVGTALLSPQRPPPARPKAYTST